MFSLFRDGPEYIRRTQTPFKPTRVALSQIHSVVPKGLNEKNTLKSFGYVLRDIICAVVVYKIGWMIDLFSCTLVEDFDLAPSIGTLVKWSAWVLYWLCQSIILAGWWCIAHEAGHGTLSSVNWVNHFIGFTMHTFILVPYYAWRSTHHAHHKATMSVERDEHYVPRPRSYYGLPSESSATLSDYHDVFEETPIYTLLRILVMQLFGLHCYLFRNLRGSLRHPSGTNHFLPSSPLFKPHERNGIIASNIGLAVMSFILYLWTQKVGLGYFIKLYFVPYLLSNHWVVMVTYLHHSDPTIAHYRKKEWSFLRGSLATVDRPLLGWAGRFFLHNVSHDHIAHHLFSSIPFYNQPKVTEAIKTVLKDDYNYDSTNSFRALYRSFTQCSFIENDGDLVVWKNRSGQAARALAPDALGQDIKEE